jgi:hypothetical protein
LERGADVRIYSFQEATNFEYIRLAKEHLEGKFPDSSYILSDITRHAWSFLKPESYQRLERSKRYDRRWLGYDSDDEEAWHININSDIWWWLP